jgi:hypothetical protein
MSARPLAQPPSTGAGTHAWRGDHPWRVVLVVLAVLVLVLGVVAIGVVASMSGLVSDVWRAATSVFDQP